LEEEEAVLVEDVAIMPSMEDDIGCTDCNYMLNELERRA